MSDSVNPIGWHEASGTPYEIGQAMGVRGREAVHTHLVDTEIWSAITAGEHTETITRLMENTRTRFPEIYEELLGLANGLQLPFVDVLAWNCRGDILASVPDGCTTIQTPGERIHISHNEDGLPFFRGHCFILDAKPQASMAFRAFCYPGSLAGHTFGWNDAGLTHAVNNLRLRNANVTIPRMVLARAALAASGLKDAVRTLTNDPSSGGFHMTLAQVGEPDLLSVEFGGGDISVVKIKARDGHANHALHLPAPEQIITRSSGDRQKTLSHLVANSAMTDLDILSDTSGPGLPIRRDAPDDPDQENTLATCLFTVSTTDVEWRIYGEKGKRAAYQYAREIA